MKNRSRSATIALSVLTIVCSLSLLIGATFALFTDRQDNDVSFSSGKISFVADLELTKLYGTSEDGESTTDGVVNEDNLSGRYPGNGTIEIKASSESLDDLAFAVNMNGVAQGETAEFSLNITDTGSVKMKYLVYLEGKTEADIALLNALDISIGNEQIATIGSRKVLQDWTVYSNETSIVEGIKITLPWNTSEVNGTLNLGIEAVQYNASTQATVNGEVVGNLEEAFDIIAKDDVSDNFEVVVAEGAQSIPDADLSGKNVKLIGANGAENTVLNGDYNVSSGSVAMEDVTFNGDITGSGEWLRSRT